MPEPARPTINVRPIKEAAERILPPDWVSRAAFLGLQDQIPRERAAVLEGVIRAMLEEGDARRKARQ